jgi:hypothetical protein
VTGFLFDDVRVSQTRSRSIEMPGLAPPAKDECESLLGFLDQQRYGVRLAAYGLNDRQASSSPSPSALCVGGLIKHLAGVERFWIQVAQGKVEQPESESAGAEDYENGFRLLSSETLEELLDDYAEAGSETDRIVRSLDMSSPVPVPPDVPWFPKDVDAWSVRWVVLHLIEETARHAGHADIVREAVDGATAFPLMAAAEGWPESPWIKPWKAAS